MRARAVPPVRRWRVRYYSHNACIAAVTVRAPNKEFAYWAASMAARAAAHAATRKSATVRPTKRKGV